MGANIAKHTHEHTIFYPSSVLVPFPNPDVRSVGDVVRIFHALPPGTILFTVTRSLEAVRLLVL